MSLCLIKGHSRLGHQHLEFSILHHVQGITKGDLVVIISTEVVIISAEVGDIMPHTTTNVVSCVIRTRILLEIVLVVWAEGMEEAQGEPKLICALLVIRAIMIEAHQVQHRSICVLQYNNCLIALI